MFSWCYFLSFLFYPECEYFSVKSTAAWYNMESSLSTRMMKYLSISGHADQYICTCQDHLICIYVKSNILQENDWIGTKIPDQKCHPHLTGYI